MVVSGERHREVQDEKGDSSLRTEKVYGCFERSFTLPPTVSFDKIEAHFENGVLNVALPKAEAAKGRNIEIQSGQGGFFSHLLNGKREEQKNSKDVKIT